LEEYLDNVNSENRVGMIHKKVRRCGFDWRRLNNIKFKRGWIRKIAQNPAQKLIFDLRSKGVQYYLAEREWQAGALPQGS